MFLPPYIFAKLGLGGGGDLRWFLSAYTVRARIVGRFFFYVAGFAYVYTCVPRDKACSCQYPRDRISTGKRMRPAAVVFPVGLLLF